MKTGDLVNGNFSVLLNPCNLRIAFSDEAVAESFGYCFGF